MPQYYYIIDRAEKSATCFCDLKEAKKMALEKKSLIYRAKAELPREIEKVEGFCHEALRRPDGKFSKKLGIKFFNEDVKKLLDK